MAVPADPRPRLLIMAWSTLRSDARVLRQIRLFSSRYAVTTLGYGEAPDGVVEHLRLPDEVVHWHKDRRLLVLRRFEAAYRSAPVTLEAAELLAGQRRFVVVLADDIDTLPLALDLAPTGGVHADLHEYHPRQNEESRRWRTFVAPYYRWLVRRYGPLADSVTTVGEGIAREYRLRFGLRAGVVVNAPQFVDLDPRPVEGGAPLRLVHSGNAQRHRLDVILEAMELVTRPMTLDLYLMPNDPAYLEQLRERYAGSASVQIHPPVAPHELPATLNAHDVGVYVLPPVSFNHLWALPNKIFDFVQGRLALVVGPSPEMSALVRRHGLGLVSADFTAQALAATLDSLDAEQVAGFKAAADEAAHELSAEQQVRGWERAVDTLAARVNG
ncbi:capsular polysacchardie synthesis protein [Serinicoccus hydrothermalis]|uniref:Capsular polysacchardie synthesis protein n=1 Tax=Serinicoccus hydrothermalis TaxID=1758689 RepID=A0A1B1N927_9MICO|nr:glycosyltransferase family 1 protein [Serinicoccus hydrothermalis]ANS77940.1 capsular polysacchardie synthesis protein [Serinicoccus hydrothermalis]